MGRLQVFRKALQSYITLPIVSFLAKLSITPNMVTWFGFLVLLVSAWLAAIGQLFAAGWVMLLAGFFDMIDGALARHTNQVTRFGGCLIRHWTTFRLPSDRHHRILPFQPSRQLNGSSCLSSRPDKFVPVIISAPGLKLPILIAR
jgi:hypothetical protein